MYDPRGFMVLGKPRKFIGRFTGGDSMGLGSYLGKDLQSMKRIVAGFKRAAVFKR